MTLKFERPNERKTKSISYTFGSNFPSPVLWMTVQGKYPWLENITTKMLQNDVTCSVYVYELKYN